MVMVSSSSSLGSKSLWLQLAYLDREVLLNILSDAREGKGRLRSHADWITHLRGQNIARVLIKQNNSQSQAFMDSVVPVGN